MHKLWELRHPALFENHEGRTPKVLSGGNRLVESGDEVLPGALPMEDMDLVVAPKSAWWTLERFKQFYSRSLSAARATGLRQQFGQCVFKPL